MSRFNSWLNELQPEMFAELSHELAAERGIVHGGWMTIRTARGRIEARAMVTRRLRPFVVEGAWSTRSVSPSTGLSLGSASAATPTT
jgi:formate dehydrogenase major subunit